MDAATTDAASGVFSFPKSKIKVLLLEGIDQTAGDRFRAEGFTVEELKSALPKEELIEKLKDVYVLGIRSASDLTAEVLKSARRLLAVGCFCIGTNQVDLDAARTLGIPVFNSPFSNSRSVAELIIGQVINLARQLGVANAQMHAGQWQKFTKNRFEIRGKTLGIVGYGNIGTQLSVLAEAMGLRVIFYDVLHKLPLGNAKAMDSLDSLLRQADFVTLHVPLAPSTSNMIGAAQIALMKKGSYLLNASRGTVVVIDDAVAALKSGHLAGAYFDVYPVEPQSSNSTFETPLQGLNNVMLTPHLGGATHEAQAAIGVEVSSKLLDFINSGSTSSAVNFPQLQLASCETGFHRILNIHKNVPGVLKDINLILSDFNINAQVLGTQKDTGFLIVDVDRVAGKEVYDRISALPVNVRTRILY